MRRNAIKTVETSVSTEASSKWYFSNTALVRRLIVVADMTMSRKLSLSVHPVGCIECRPNLHSRKNRLPKGGFFCLRFSRNGRS